MKIKRDQYLERLVALRIVQKGNFQGIFGSSIGGFITERFPDALCISSIGRALGAAWRDII